MNESTKTDEKSGGGGEDSSNYQHAPEDVVSESLRAQSMEECLGKSLESLSKAFTSSAKRWETIVYPSLFAFILLASYGFYLIYNLTTDVSRVAGHMESIARNMDAVSHNMVVMTQTVDSQSAAMNEMTLHMRHMSVSMGQMRYDMSVMNNSVSRPMQFMNSFMPW
jgi:methyl-accepting chemotaxis protein